MSARICICDDDPVVAELLQRELEAAGFDVQEPLSGVEQAMGWLELDPPDVLILDLNMPVGGGLDLLGWLSGRRMLDRTRVLMLTGEAEPFFIDRARQLGASGYLIKPVQPGRVTAKVRRLLVDPGVRWIDDYTTLSAPQPSSGPALDGLNPTVAELARTYGEPAVRSLLQALLTQLERFPAAPDRPADLAGSAHAARGAAASMGFEAIAAACGDLERSARAGAPTELCFRRAAEACDHGRRDISAFLKAAA